MTQIAQGSIVAGGLWNGGCDHVVLDRECSLINGKSGRTVGDVFIGQLLLEMVRWIDKGQCGIR